MGTRGAICFVVNENEKTVYNHFDSYPDGLGQDVLNWLRSALSSSSVESLRAAALALVPVTDDVPPTPAQQEKLAPFRDPHVNGGKGWYSLLRHTQGIPGAILEAGFYEAAPEFPLDSLFCEWCYVVDLDEWAFEVYEGFQRSPEIEGRWKGQLQAPLPHRNFAPPEYHPVSRIAKYRFDALPDVLPSFSEDE